MKKTMERILIFTGVYLYFILIYKAVEIFNSNRGQFILKWDPVWHIPLFTSFVLVYLSAFVLPALALFLIKDNSKFRHLALLFIIVITVSAISFMALPLALPRPDITSAGISSKILQWLYAFDGSGNLFPSLHVSLTFLPTFAIAEERPSWRPWLILWAVLVAVSTVLVRQHYFVDVIGGAAVAVAGWKIFQIFERT